MEERAVVPIQEIVFQGTVVGGDGQGDDTRQGEPAAHDYREAELASAGFLRVAI